MAAFQTKASRLAIVEETTEGTPKFPSSATEYIALQDGYDVEPAFDTLENAELTGSIGKAKPVLGLENPTVTLSHYIRHSGVEGQAPNFGPLVEGAFGGSSVASTEYDLVGGSTAGSATLAPVLNVGGGEGATFEDGEALLIKDATNGYQIRNITSITGDALTVNFNLAGAPAATTNLGKAVLYKPGTLFPTFSVHDYRGNGAAVQLVAGATVTELGIEANAGEFVNGSFSLEGLSYYFNPVEITATSNKLDFNDGAVRVATVPVDVYKDPHDLAAAVALAMNDASPETYTVVYSDSTGKFTIATSTAGSLSLLWNTGANAANTIGAKLGFSTAADDTAALTYTSDNALDIDSPQTPSFDAADPLVAKNNEVFLGDHTDNVNFCASAVSMTISNEKTDVLCVTAASGKDESIITRREVSVEISAVLDQYESDKFHRFHTNQTTQFMYNFGEKVGGNWVAGKSVNLYLPTATISAFKVEDQDGYVALSMTLSAFVDSSGGGEVFLNFL